MSYAYQCSQHIGMYGAEKAKLRTKALIHFIEFVRPDGYWPQPYTLEQAFHVFQWMVKTGKEFSKYQHSGVFDLLNKKPTCIGHSEANPITSTKDLRERFHYALLSDCAGLLADQWRHEHGIFVTKKKWLMFPHYTPFAPTDAYKSEAAIRDAFDALMTKSRGKIFKFSLNPCHKKATWIEKVVVTVTPKGFSFVASYGYEKDQGSSSWQYVLAATADREPFTSTLYRAEAKLAALTAPGEDIALIADQAKN